MSDLLENLNKNPTPFVANKLGTTSEMSENGMLHMVSKLVYGQKCASEDIGPQEGVL